MGKINKLISIFVIFLLASAKATEINVTNFPGEDCYRDCNNAQPTVCYFNWKLEHFHSMGPACGTCGQVNGSMSDCFNTQCITVDGEQRGLMSINRQIPGPPINVCQGDRIVVDVTNLMAGTAATIHWHGQHQVETPHMDGVPFITQCPIDFATTFRYSFKAEQPGTHFYHSHTGHHKVNGHYGGLIVRRPKTDDPNADLFDYDLKDHLIIASDWIRYYGEEFSPGLPSKEGNLLPKSYLINGFGAIIDREQCRPKTATPLAVFRVEFGQRYRFRFVNSMSLGCPVKLEIQNHSMQIIASDSYDLQPVDVDSLWSTSGERFDFVLNANQSAGSYWVRIRALGLCEDLKIEQFAVLSYAPSAITNLALAFPCGRKIPQFGADFGGLGRSLNNPNATCSDQTPGKKELCVTDLSSHVTPSITSGNPDIRFILGFDLYPRPLNEVEGPDRYGDYMCLTDEVFFVGGINNISFAFPPFSLLTQPQLAADSIFCDPDNLPAHCASNSNEICHCIYRIKVDLNAIVELVIVDEAEFTGPLNHPFHLHGYKVFVTGMGQHPDGIPMTVALASRMVRTRTLVRSANTMPPIKDTISIPSRGFTIFRFQATNPGFWFLHCHFELHANVGMGLLLQVGETSEMVPPPANFPQCNSYTPAVDTSDL